MRSKAHNQNKFMRIITIPFRVLGKARDLYVQSLTNCASSVSYGGNTVGAQGELPRSFSVTSAKSHDGDDFRELVRAASTSTLAKRIEIDMFLQQQMRQSADTGPKKVPRSCSVGMGKIDEEIPCDFVGESVKAKPGSLYPRSKSHAVTKRSVLVS